ncbi:hypothetical protein F4801DRAFT_537384 [Xylaria longipes]|nr:hypothetical protein F4801DRAFT_537384 [Xylaria longipes]
MALTAFTRRPGLLQKAWMNPSFYAKISFFLVAMTLLCAAFMVASVLTNVVLFLLLPLLVSTCKKLLSCSLNKDQSTADLDWEMIGCLSASFFAIAHDLPMREKTLQHAGAGLLLAVSFLRWYIFLALVLSCVEFPFILPLGDLLTVVPLRRDGI